jgi:RNA polymerase sigma factor (TIGR02999 family)
MVLIQDAADAIVTANGFGLMPIETSITLLLRDLAHGDKAALDQLMPLLYNQLRKIADGFLRNERPGHTLQPTALVNELYARVALQEQPEYRDRAHFLGVAAIVMREILIDHARARSAAKRGGSSERFPLEEARQAAFERAPEIVAVDDALCELEKRDPRKARLVQMRFFGGLTAEESAEVLQMPVNAVRRELRVAQAWLQRELDFRSAGR